MFIVLYEVNGLWNILCDYLCASIEFFYLKLCFVLKMGNKKRVGTRRTAYKKKTVVRKPKVNEVMESSTTSEKPDSASKVKLVSNFDFYNARSDENQYEIVDFKTLQEAIIDVAVCKYCLQNLAIEKKVIEGLATEFRLFCKNCSNNEKRFMNCDKIRKQCDDKEKDFYDVNLRLVCGLRTIGKGYTSAQILCGIMNLPSPPTKFKKHEAVLSAAMEVVCKASMKNAVEEAVMECNGRDLCVALDGSWQKRGYTSLNGIVSLTSVDTGKVLDIEVMSKFCKCPNKEKNEHTDTCEATYLGTSGGMEVAGATKLFQRSQTTYNVRYTEYLGDGDTKAFMAVRDSKPYGEEVEIKKLECIGHVQKRVGTQLRNLKSHAKGKLSDGKPLSGKNRLTDTAIQKLQTFYGLAIRRNTHSVQEMYRAVWAEYFHVASSNEQPNHHLCPANEDTWCKFNRCKLTGEKYDHSEHFHLPKVIMEKIKPIFQNLSNPLLLQKCVKGKTQNPNESLNNVIWVRLPKRSFVQKLTLFYGVYDAVSSFNDGCKSKVMLLEELGLTPGKNMLNAMRKLDMLRISDAERKSSELEKRIREKRTLAKRKLEDVYQQEEDPDQPSYSGGLY